MSYTRQQLETWLKTISVKGTMLDIGGSVQGLKGRVKSYKPLSYTIMDNGSEKGLHEKWQEPDIEWDICNNIFQDSGFRIYEQIFMIEVSEYLSDPIQAVENISNMLIKGGEFYSSWHFIYPLHPPIGKDYFRYTPAGVEMLIKNAGFEIVEHISRVTEKSNLVGLWQDEQMRGYKEFDNSVIGSLVKARKL